MYSVVSVPTTVGEVLGSVSAEMKRCYNSGMLSKYNTGSYTLRRGNYQVGDRPRSLVL